MRKAAIITTLLFCFTFSAFKKAEPQNKFADKADGSSLRTVKHNNFAPGEILEYRLHYGMVNAGTAKLEVQKVNKKVAGREVVRVVGTGRSRGAFDWFFKVRDHYESYLDAEGVFPWIFVRRVSEGGYKINQDYKFLQHKQKVDDGEGKLHSTPFGVQDMLSAFYYARTIDFSDAEMGEEFTIETFVDGELWPLKMKYKGLDTITVKEGTFSCIKFHPVIQEGRIFEDEDDLNVWVTNDGNKIPILAQAKVLVGSIKMEITNFEGLANPVSKLDK